MQGRFTSPDEFTGGPDELYNFAESASNNPLFYGDLTNPHSLNKYQFSYSNPLRYVDADGHEPDDPDPQGQGCPRCIPVPAGPTPPEVVDVTVRLLQKLWRDTTAPSTPTTGIPGMPGDLLTNPDGQISPIPVPGDVATAPLPPSQQTQPLPAPAPIQAKQSKVNKSTTVQTIGGKFEKKTKIIPGQGPGQSRSENVIIRNAAGKVIRTFKDSYDRANKFKHRKHLRGGPEGRPAN
jgi:hypothetical protein